jgi:hypothetical protein
MVGPGSSSACNAVPADLTTIATTSSSAYPPSADCGLAVTGMPPPGNVTALTFSAMDVQGPGDMVWVHDGVDASAPVIALFSSASSYYVGTGPDTMFPFTAVVRAVPCTASRACTLTCILHRHRWRVVTALA